MADGCERSEGVALAGGVVLVVEEGGEEVGRIGHELGEVGEDGCDGKGSVLADVCVTVCETLSDGL